MLKGVVIIVNKINIYVLWNFVLINCIVKWLVRFFFIVKFGGCKCYVYIIFFLILSILYNSNKWIDVIFLLRFGILVIVWLLLNWIWILSLLVLWCLLFDFDLKFCWYYLEDIILKLVKLLL